MTDHTFEDLVRESLASAVAGTGAPPRLPRRRVRARQAALMGAAVAVAVLGSFGAVRAGDLFAAPDLVPAGPSGELMDARGAGGEYPCSMTPAGPRSDPGYCVAEGARGDFNWKLGVDVDPKHGFCLILETIGGPGAAGAGSSCIEYIPEQINIDQMGVEGLPMLAYGHVPEGTERLFLEHGAEDSFELQVYPTPEGFPIPGGFYLVWLPDDAVRLVAHDDGGDVLATLPFDGSPTGREAEETERVTVLNIGHEESMWALEAYGTVEDGRDIVCTRMLLPGAETEALAPCDPSFGRDSLVGMAPSTSDEDPGVIAFGGVTSKTVGSVRFLTEEGKVITVLTLEPPKKIDQSLRFFAAFVPAENGVVRGTILVRDRSGEVLEERDYCVPGGDALSC